MGPLGGGDPEPRCTQKRSKKGSFIGEGRSEVTSQNCSWTDSFEAVPNECRFMHSLHYSELFIVDARNAMIRADALCHTPSHHLILHRKLKILSWWSPSRHHLPQDPRTIKTSKSSHSKNEGENDIYTYINKLYSLSVPSGEVNSSKPNTYNHVTYLSRTSPSYCIINHFPFFLEVSTQVVVPSAWGR